MTDMRCLFLLLSLVIVHDAHAGQDTPALCKDYMQEGGPVDAGNMPPRDSIPHGTGLLWKIADRGGRQSHLFGTMHSQDRRVTGLPPQVRLALAQSRLLLMEIVPDRSAAQTFTNAIYATDGPGLDTLVDQEIFHKLVQILPPYGIEEKNAHNLKPWAAFTLIGRPRPVRAASLDDVLMQTASAMGKDIAGLESMDELVTTLDGIPVPDQIEILNDTVCNHARIIHDTLDLVNMYIARDLAGMMAFNEQPHQDEAVFKRYMQRIVYDRNRRMLGRMENYLHEGGAFISVGALHLPGAGGLLDLLEQKGYKVTLEY